MEGLWREIHLYSDLDNYNHRVDRYHHAFIAAILQPELTQQLKGNNIALLADMAGNLEGLSGVGSDLADLAGFLAHGGTFFRLPPDSIQTTLENWETVSRRVSFGNSLDKLGTALGGVSTVAEIAQDTLRDIFLHSITNAQALERMAVLDRFVDEMSVSDPAIRGGCRA